MNYKTDVTPIITAAEAVQTLIEAIQPLERAGPPEVRETLARTRGKRAEPMQWVDEQR